MGFLARYMKICTNENGRKEKWLTLDSERHTHLKKASLISGMRGEVLMTIPLMVIR